jgi:DNA-binding HxlR family transcriptional regulator
MSPHAKFSRNCDFPPEKRALLHEILERIADKWTLLVIEALDGEGELRFSDLQRRVGQRQPEDVDQDPAPART